METKVCTRCPENGEQPVGNFYIKNGRSKRRSYCRKCQNKARTQRYVPTGIPIFGEIQYRKPRMYTDVNECWRVQAIRSYYRGKEKITDTYVKRIICNRDKIAYSDIPQKIIEIKRKQIKLQRHAKAIKENQCY